MEVTVDMKLYSILCDRDMAKVPNGLNNRIEFFFLKSHNRIYDIGSKREKSLRNLRVVP